MLWLFIFSLFVLLASNQCACFMFTFPVILGENDVTVIFFSANERLSVKSFNFNSQVTLLRVIM